MTNPTPVPSSEAEQQRLKRGATVTLETRKQFQGHVVAASETSVVLTFPGSEDLDQQLSQADANEAHLVFNIGHQPGTLLDFSVLVFLNTPAATAATPITGGFVSSVAFFEHTGHVEPGPVAPFRLPLTAALKQAPTPSGTAITATFVPVAFPGRESTPQVLDVRPATLDLVNSKVVRTQ